MSLTFVFFKEKIPSLYLKQWNYVKLSSTLLNIYLVKNKYFNQIYGIYLPKNNYMWIYDDDDPFGFLTLNICYVKCFH